MEVSEFLVAFSALAVLFVVWYFLFVDAELALYLADKFGRRVSSYRGKVIWITGASMGLGEAMAYELASVGAKLILSARNEALLQKVRVKCLDISQGKLIPRDVLVLPFDIADHDGHKAKVADALKHFGEIHVLINNAGVSQVGPFESTNYKTDERLFAVNVLGSVNLSRMLLKHFLEKKRGQIVVISSLMGKCAFPFLGTYTATKHALHGYFESLRLEHCCNNIDITVVCPGTFSSNLALNCMTTEEGKVLGKTRFSSAEMTASRSAHLALVAAVNNFVEAWFSNQSILFLMSLQYYFPSLAKRLFTTLIRLKPAMVKQTDYSWPKEIPLWKPIFK